MLSEDNFLTSETESPSFIFPIPVSGENLIEIYSNLFFAAKSRGIFCEPRISISSNLHYILRMEKKVQENPHLQYTMEIKPVKDERVVDFYYGYQIEDLVQRYLIIRNPESPNWYSHLIFIPRGMEKEFLNIYRLVYRNRPYNYQNEVMIFSPPQLSE